MVELSAFDFVQYLDGFVAEDNIASTVYVHCYLFDFYLYRVVVFVCECQRLRRLFLYCIDKLACQSLIKPVALADIRPLSLLRRCASGGQQQAYADDV